MIEVAAALHASPSSGESDSTSNRLKGISLGIGLNRGLEADQPSSLVIPSGPIFRLSDRRSIPIDFALWRLKSYDKLATNLRVSASGEYEIPLVKDLSLNVKVGQGVLFTTPVVTMNVGTRVRYALWSGFILFIEPGTLVRPVTGRSGLVT